MNIKEENKEEFNYRMFGMVNYQLMGIQSGIQFQHAVSRYQRDYPSDSLNKWAFHCETSIVLDGGSTNLNPNKLGTMNKHLQTLKEMNLIVSEFYEEDLGDQLTAIAFLVDERVYDKEKYPNFLFDKTDDKLNPNFTDETRQKEWDDYIDMIGGYQNHKLRTFLGTFKLAS